MQVPVALTDQTPIVPSSYGRSGACSRLRRMWDRHCAAVLCRGGSLALLLALALPASAETPLRIGVLTDMTGPYGDASGAGSVAAAQLAVADFGPTVLGRPIE